MEVEKGQVGVHLLRRGRDQIAVFRGPADIGMLDHDGCVPEDICLLVAQRLLHMVSQRRLKCREPLALSREGGVDEAPHVGHARLAFIHRHLHLAVRRA